MSVFRNLLMQSTGWLGKPSDWSDIRKDCPANSIALYAGHTADYSKYDNLGFTATCIGGYKVYIDGEHYGTYASASQCNIIWSQSGINTGDDITTPSALKAHKIWIEPATEGENITAFACKRVATSGTEQQGVLWAHFNVTNQISLRDAFCNLYSDTGQFRQQLLTAITAKNNKITFTDIFQAFAQCVSLEYVPSLIDNNNTKLSYASFWNCQAIKQITLKDIKTTGGTIFKDCFELQNIKGNVIIAIDPASQIFSNCYKLKKLPALDASTATNMTDFLTNAVSLQDTVLDVSSATNLTRIGCYGNSTYFMAGLKGLRVSNEAPFNNATTPQINVNYTGMDRNALVQLFNDLPYNVGYEVVGSPTIQDGVVSGFSNSDYLSLPSHNFYDDDSFEFVVKIKRGIANSGINGTILAFPSRCKNNTSLAGAYGIYKYNNTLTVYNGFDSNNSLTSNSLPSQSAGSIIYIKWSKINNILYSHYSYDGSNWTELNNDGGAQNTEIRPNSKIILGSQATTGNWNWNGYEIDLNETYIKVNDEYWFRGQPAMTKTLSCVGATGTADLTAEDKDIALNKGWEITIS